MILVLKQEIKMIFSDEFYAMILEYEQELIETNQKEIQGEAK
jgi:hypothetical protein